MISRSESVNRTVVDLSLSFLVTVSLYSPDELLVVANEKKRNLEETDNRYRPGIVPVSPFEECSVIFTATNGHDVEMFVRESAPPSVRARSPRGALARAPKEVR